MPQKTGLQVVSAVRKIIQNFNELNQEVIEPTFVFLTAYTTTTFERYL
jgi:tRNA A37 threonylcarbamoyladenosine biosynthesis protein TsaE